MDYTADEVREARAPIASLLSKSEKAQQKVAPGTWQHTMLGDNISALRLASALISGASGEASAPTRSELEAALRALDSMIQRVENTEKKFSVGTSQHSLQRNRLRALRIARASVVASMDER